MASSAAAKALMLARIAACAGRQRYGAEEVMVLKRCGSSRFVRVRVKGGAARLQGAARPPALRCSAREVGMRVANTVRMGQR